VLSRVEAAAFPGAAELAGGDIEAATSVLEKALVPARDRRTALWYEPRILATLADAKRAAGDRSGARALLSQARDLVDRGRGWRLGAFDVALAWVRLLASDRASDRTAIESALGSLDAPHGRAGLRSLSAHRGPRASPPRAASVAIHSGSRVLKDISLVI
jgi:hypothetical protein